MLDNFIILVLTHFVSDWFFQPAKWALNKINNSKYRFFHCLQYTILFIPILYFLKLNLLWGFWIFLTHFLIDDYRFIKWWNECLKREKNVPRWLQTVQDQILHILVLIPVVLI